LAATVCLGAVAAWAAEFTGEVTNIDQQRRVIAVAAPGDCPCTATNYVVPADIDMRWVSTGATITVTFNPSPNGNTVTKLAK